MKRIYLDYAATTPLASRVKMVMEPLLSKNFGNPSSIHAEGVAAKKAVDIARIKVARSIEAHADEIVFTSGGTEANNLAIFGTVEAFTRSDLFPDTRSDLVKPHILTTNIEHSSVLEPLQELERQGRAEVTLVPVELNGIVKVEKLISAIRPNTILVSVMYANNEIGTIQPIRRIGQLLRPIRNSKFIIHNSPNEKRYPVFHSDGCQAPLYLNCLVNSLAVDLMTFDGQKMYGPKGVGSLYVRRGTELSPMLIGGGQERGLRSTTENVPAIVGFAEALRIAVVEREKESARVEKLRDYLHSNILKNVGMTEMIINGDMKERLPNNLNISLQGVDTEFLTLKLDAAGIAVSTKSSCLKDEKESYVVAALGGRKERARSSLRFTLGRGTTKKEIAYTARILWLLFNQKDIEARPIVV